jgi:hypothetical protein
LFQARALFAKLKKTYFTQVCFGKTLNYAAARFAVGCAGSKLKKGSCPERRERWAEPLASSCKQDALIVPAVLFAALPISWRGILKLPYKCKMPNEAKK